MPLVSDTTITPTAREPLQTIARTASPLIAAFSLTCKRTKAVRTQTGIASERGAIPNGYAMARAANPTWERPSPIMA